MSVGLIVPGPLLITAAIAKLAPAAYFQIEPGGLDNLLLEAQLGGSAASGSSINAYVVSSMDGVNWWDIANFEWANTPSNGLYNLSRGTPVTTKATPGFGALASNTALDGLIGDFIGVVPVTVGTYTGSTTLQIFASGPRLRRAP
jgi:hypothetical protein